MAELIYLTIASLDGYVADEAGDFGWGEPDEEVHAFINDLARTIGTYLYGRRMYEVMVAWETVSAGEAHIRDFAEIWRGADKVVYSTTLDGVSTERTRIERDFDLTVVGEMKERADSDIAIAGPELAAHAFRAGLIDECQLFLAPVVVGGGKQALPDHVRLDLELLEERRFGNGMVFLRYRVGSAETAG